MGGKESDQYAAIADVYDLWSADMSADVPYYVAEAVASGGPVLEIGVGTGRVAAAIARAGVHVVGIDNSPSMLARARRRLDEHDLADDVELVEADMRDADLGRVFPLAVLPYRVLAHALTTEELLSTLRTVRRHLEPNGRVVLNVPVPRAEDLRADDHLAFEGEFLLDDGSRAVLWRTGHYAPGTQLLTFRFVVDHLDDDDRVVDRVHGRAVMRQSSPGEIDLALRLAGFEVRTRHGWFDRREFGPDAIEYVVEAVRTDRWSRSG